MTFWLAGNPQGGAGTHIHDLLVAAGGASQTYVFDSTGKTISNLGYVQQTLLFTATTTTTVVSFTSLDIGSVFGPIIDSVIVSATDLGNTLSGGNGNDTVSANGGNDTLTGGSGNDLLTGGLGADTFVRDGNDAAAVQADVITDFTVGTDKLGLGIAGPASYEVLLNHLLRSNGSGFAELRGRWNNNLQTTTLTGVALASLTAGEFIFDSSATARVLTGTAGDDQFFGGLGNDTFTGGNGADFFAGDAGNDTFNGDAGTDRFDGGAGADTFNGGSGDDRVDYNTVGGVTLILNAAGVAIAGSSAEALGDTFNSIEHIRGTAEDDTLTLDTADTTVRVLSGFGGNDVLTGSAGFNDIQGGDGNDTLNGGDGNDVLTGGTGADQVNGEGGNDTAYDADGMSGDIYTGGSGADGVIYQTGGTFDFSLANAARDIIASDIEYVRFDAQVTVTGSAGVDRFNGSALADTISGGGGNDWLIGGSGDDVLNGDADNDRLQGGIGADTFDGGTGGDTYEGGTGADTFVFRNIGSGVDGVLDFSSIQGDKLVFLASDFAPASAGALPAAQFISGAGVSTPTTAEETLVYNTANGYLYYDANGSAVGGLTLVAVITGAPTLAVSDFQLI